jgi:lycopene cyclase domain-containing protein
MRHFGYLAMLAFTVIGSFWLEIFIKVGVLKRIRKVLKALLPGFILFVIWDAYAISRGHWHFDLSQILGVFGPFNIPLEEYLFFAIVPIAAIMTIEAVTKVRKDLGDEL